MTLRIATWNVNSIKARLPVVLDWVGTVAPDVVLFQEIKCESDAFPRLEFEALGYVCAVHGQKAYNGVAILSKRPLDGATVGLPGAAGAGPGGTDDGQARYLEAGVDGLRIASVYLPNGNPVASDKYPYKLAWMARLRNHAAALLRTGQPFVLGGDFNVIPTEDDVYDPAGWRDDALFRSETRHAFRSLLNLGLTEAYRALHPPEEGPAYTFWDYQAGRWQHDEGLRIDHFVLSPQVADRLTACRIDREPRGREKASDHTPVLLELVA